MIILIGIVTGLVKLTALVVSKIKGDDTQKTNKVLNNTSSVAVKEDTSSAEDKKTSLRSIQIWTLQCVLMQATVIMTAAQLTPQEKDMKKTIT